MALQAFLIFRYTTFSFIPILVGFSWHAFNDMVDYFIPLIGSPHHTWLPSEMIGGVIYHTGPAHLMAAAGAILLTCISVALLLISIYPFSQKL